MDIQPTKSNSSEATHDVRKARKSTTSKGGVPSNKGGSEHSQSGSASSSAPVDKLKLFAKEIEKIDDIRLEKVEAAKKKIHDPSYFNEERYDQLAKSILSQLNTLKEDL